MRVKLASNSVDFDEDGNEITKLTFQEMLPDHARFVIMIVLE